MRSLTRASSALAIAGLVAAACGTGAATSPARTAGSTQVPTAPPATTAATGRPPVAPIPTTDGAGPEYVTGTSVVTVTKDGTQTIVGDVTQLRGQEMTDNGTLTDPRLVGPAHITLNLDLHDTVASEWGTTRIENAGGSWEGTWTGASWNAGNATAVSGWLIGGGGYTGYTYYFHAYGPSMPFTVEGIIFQGSPPTP